MMRCMMPLSRQRERRRKRRDEAKKLVMQAQARRVPTTEHSSMSFGVDGEWLMVVVWNPAHQFSYII